MNLLNSYLVGADPTFTKIFKPRFRAIKAGVVKAMKSDSILMAPHNWFLEHGLIDGLNLNAYDKLIVWLDFTYDRVLPKAEKAGISPDMFIEIQCNGVQQMPLGLRMVNQILEDRGHPGLIVVLHGINEGAKEDVRSLLDKTREDGRTQVIATTYTRPSSNTVNSSVNVYGLDEWTQERK